jgi:hypothetical protein
MIIECDEEAVKLQDVTCSRFVSRYTNYTYSSKGVVLVSGCDRNYFAMSCNGGAADIGYSVDSTSGYNEFNCTGIDPTGLTGGANNKLVINGTQVTATGIAAAGAGTNYASGVMA